MKTCNIPSNDNNLNELRNLFVEAGYDMWFVGGCVRDTLCGEKPKDIDLATSAFPDEQIAIYEANDIRYIATGLQHGTITAVIGNEVYEITSLRTESEHDGRHATVAYTRDLTTDLERRDLTINAMAMDFDGNLIDPFGGYDDLANRRVKIVGDSVARLTEDYLRILRYFRFFARFSDKGPIDAEAKKAIRKTREGLHKISVERIWGEMKKIISGPNASYTLSLMRDLDVLKIIGFDDFFLAAASGVQSRGVYDSASIVGWMAIDKSALEKLTQKWKWSTEEKNRAIFIAQNTRNDDYKRMLVDSYNIDWVVDLMRINEIDPQPIIAWTVPEMPVRGADLIEAGMTPGAEMGRRLRDMREAWIASDYTLTKDELIETVG